MDTHPRTRASEEPKAITGNESCEEKGSLPNAQAACTFRYSALKRAPFFQTSKVIAAILRANVRRAMPTKLQVSNTFLQTRRISVGMTMPARSYVVS